ncbi:hypothetical protein [Gloeobacter morelensis]|nr:hypothetical protein [Gloeobacter morelensis]
MSDRRRFVNGLARRLSVVRAKEILVLRVYIAGPMLEPQGSA